MDIWINGAFTVLGAIIGAVPTIIFSLITIKKNREQADALIEKEKAYSLERLELEHKNALYLSNWNQKVAIYKELMGLLSFVENELNALPETKAAVLSPTYMQAAGSLANYYSQNSVLLEMYFSRDFSSDVKKLIQLIEDTVSEINDDIYIEECYRGRNNIQTAINDLVKKSSEDMFKN